LIADRMTDKDTEVLAPAARALAADSERFVAGTLVGSWRISSLIAAGGCGVVYAARHPVLDRVAAIKVLHAELARSPSMVDRFVREARAVNQIRHPNIVDIFDFGTLADGRPYFIMELLAPDDLEQRVAASGRLVVAEVVAILTPICLALDAAHRAGYIHRDLKARNIGFAPGDDGAWIPKLLDFGIAKLLEDDRDGATATIRVGTPHCMAPEQIRGARVDARTDVYALGVLLHHLLTGRYPFEAADAAELERLHLEAPPPAPSRLAPVPAALDALVIHALAKSPDARPSVRALLAALTDAAPAAPVRRDAIAIRVALDVPQAFDDDDLETAAAVTELAVTRLAAAGFTPVLITGTSVVAAHVIDGAPAAAHARAVELARAIEAELDAELAIAVAATRPTPRSPIVTRVVVHAAPVELAIETGALVGGPLLDLHTWPR
jgi:serine/threonine-protein kinase